MIKWLFLFLLPLNYLFADTLPPAKKKIPTKNNPYQWAIDFYDREWICNSNPQCYTFWKAKYNGLGQGGYCHNYFRMNFDYNFKKFEADVCLFDSEQIYQRLSGSCQRQFIDFEFNFDTIPNCYLSSKPIDVATKDNENYYLLPIETDSFLVTENGKSRIIIPKDTFIYYRKIMDSTICEMYKRTMNGMYLTREIDELQENKLMFVQSSYFYRFLSDTNYIFIKSFAYKTLDTDATIQIFAKNEVSVPFVLPKNGKFVINFHYNPIKKTTQKTAKLYYHEVSTHYGGHFDFLFNFYERALHYRTESVLQFKNWDFLMPNTQSEIHLYGIDCEENLNNNPWYIRK